jgi:hypothetical protein
MESRRATFNRCSAAEYQKSSRAYGAEDLHCSLRQFGLVAAAGSWGQQLGLDDRMTWLFVVGLIMIQSMAGASLAMVNFQMKSAVVVLLYRT